jgi:hypothetical protein
MFVTIPIDLQLKVCEKIVYHRSQELIDELSSVIVIRELMILFHQGECPMLKPTPEDVQSEILKYPDLSRDSSSRTKSIARAT